MRLREVMSFSAFALIITLVLAYFGSLGLRVNPPDERTNLSMDIPEINNLVPGSNVLLRGVPVGKVNNTSTSLQAATVNFWIDPRYRIPLDSEVRIENLSALGEAYIAVIPRSEGGPALRDGQRIATEAITQPPSVSELATSVVRVLDQLDVGSVKRIIDQLDTALPNPTTVLPNLSRTSMLLKNAARDMRGRGHVLLDNFQALLQNAEWVGPVLYGLTPSLEETLRWSQDMFKGIPGFLHRGEPENTINLNNLVARLQGFLDIAGGDLKILGEAMLPKLNAIAAALMNFDTGQILDNMLAAVPPDGAITLRVLPP
ncbi:MlaD family protein [Mycolicibacterium holsaticum]|uniref:Mammalian cell entry protein n=1 Tax=Mycolicibacterium holsaticum TaxID=152142 RepID=A0A1E3RU87_9MYCO|nr:MlaD family protein [Mycolicibacterium holsaticum]ODQ93391.1 mammalian cell entry protein [Mycolicibacterium holsaticum]